MMSTTSRLFTSSCVLRIVVLTLALVVASADFAKSIVAGVKDPSKAGPAVQKLIQTLVHSDPPEGVPSSIQERAYSSPIWYTPEVSKMAKK